jgi:hypothetical protein
MVAAWAVAAAGCLSPVIPIGSGKSPRQGQMQGISKLMPAPLTAPRRWEGEVRVGKLRVWGDAEYRAQNVHWQQGFEEQIDAVNQVTIPLLGVRLEAKYEAWDRHAPGSTLSDHAAALEQHDPGEDVVWVVGVTSALSLVSPTYDQLGIAQLAGRHLIVRGHADLEERKAFEGAFPDLEREEREQVLDARRRHKTAAVLLHELAHSLGALHEAIDESLMGATYSHLSVSISDRNRELMLIVLEERLAPAERRDPRATAERRLAALEAAGGGWVDTERAEAIDHLRAELAGQPAEAAAALTGAPAGKLAGRPTGIAAPVPAAASAQLRRAEQLLASGDHGGALAELEPLVAAYPAHAEVRTLGCKIELARGGPKDAKAIAACERAAQLSTGVEPAIAFAKARLAAGDAAGGRSTLVAAEGRLASLPADQAAAGWLALARQYREMGAVTWTEDAVARAGDPAGTKDLAQWAAQARVRHGIPRDGARWKLTPDADAAALAAVRSTLDLVYAGKYAAAQQAAAAAEKRWPALPGLLAVRCDLEFRRGALGAARQLCERAIVGNGSSWALYLLGVLHLRDTGPSGTAAGIKRLREAIALDPDLGQAWRALGKALEQRAKDPAALDQLRRDHQARFGEPLR